MKSDVKKFKYLGEDGTFTLELIHFGIKKDMEYMNHGEVVEVPVEYDRCISALNASGLFVEVPATSNKVSSKKEEKD